MKEANKVVPQSTAILGGVLPGSIMKEISESKERDGRWGTANCLSRLLKHFLGDKRSRPTTDVHAHQAAHVRTRPWYPLDGVCATVAASGFFFLPPSDIFTRRCADGS